MTTPYANFPRNAQWGLYYWIIITLQLRGPAPRECQTIFDFQIRGSQNIAEVPLEIYEPPIPKYLFSHLFMFFLINKILRNNDLNEI